MDESTTKPSDKEQRSGASEKNSEANGSILSRVGRWFGTKKQKDTDATPTAAVEQPPGSVLQDTNMSKSIETEQKKILKAPAEKPMQAGGENPAADAEREGAKKSKSRRGGRKRGGQRRKQASAQGAAKQAEPAKEKQAKECPAKPAPRTKAKKDEESAPAGGPCKLLINADEPEECRIALLVEGKVEGFYVETVSHAQTKGNLYKAVVTSVEPSLQAAFVDFGLGKNGFLPFGEIHPEYYFKEVGEDTHWKDLQIQDVVRKGQELLVEVVKEAVGTKGANLTTYLSLPGRYLVLMPGSDSAGISRKIEDESQRTRLREMMDSFAIPEGIGYIIRTASQEITKTALSQDVRFLLNLWKDIKERGMSMPTPSLIYKEQNIISRFLRDHYTTDIQEIIVDNQEGLDQVQRFRSLLPPAQRKKTAVRLHKGTQPLFDQFHVEKQIEQIYQPRVTLPSGGSIVISPTEALVAIDVNSGRTAKDKNFEETIFLANMEAAEELARQLRLRDLGGLIVVDFIDMRDAKHVREVEKKVRTSMKRDKAKTDFSKISKFGLMQISRQKMASPVQTGSYKVCPHCQGRGMIRSIETLALVYLRRLQTGLTRKNIQRVSCRLPMEVAQYILNKKRQDIVELEERYGVEVIIYPDPVMGPSEHRIDFIRENQEIPAAPEQTTAKAR